jgi:hypothetical protein
VEVWESSFGVRLNPAREHNTCHLKLTRPRLVVVPFVLHHTSYRNLSSSNRMWPFTSSTKKEEHNSVTRSDRQKCWDARDAYFSCLDGQGVIKVGDEKGACDKELAVYEGSCAKSWVCLHP